jgi:biopolymer transport protein ExbD
MSTSNRARRMAMHHARNKAGFELNLIPLIDILSVMVSFLLVYSTEVEVLQNSRNIDVPQSIAKQAPRQSVVLMITKTDVYVQATHVSSVADLTADKEPIMAPLRAALKNPQVVGQQVAEREIANREVTIMADKSLPYEVLKKVMATCTDSDYGKISLATLQKEKPVPPGGVKPV